MMRRARPRGRIFTDQARATARDIARLILGLAVLAVLRHLIGPAMFDQALL